MLNHPVCLCAFRPFFLLSLASGLISLFLWLGFLQGWWVLPATASGIIVWHAHELLFGFVMASLAGFILTAMPEFTRTPDVRREVFLGLAVLWVLGRITFWASGWLGIVPAAITNMGFSLGLWLYLQPRLLANPLRRQWLFSMGLAGMAGISIGFYSDVLRELYPMRWLHAGISMMMALIVITASRIAMRIVNEAIEALPTNKDDNDLPDEYRSTPPRRNLAVFCILLYTVTHFIWPQASVNGWLALAAAASIFNVLNDWHVGKALFNRWPLQFYAVYWFMAIGYILLGLQHLGMPIPASSGWHLLSIGGMSLSVFSVLCISGRTHSGHQLDERNWVNFVTLLIIIAALSRALAGWVNLPLNLLYLVSGSAWLLAFSMTLYYLAPVFIKPRPDGGKGCEEPLPMAE
ncbi:MAG TPA: NnrS family protein [Marinospirillum sp.]|uniref:NnrS family protein n=1 Tax=Marinospirillum sp. TaxID=2183934 RepID=UPI002B4919FD|nr:NnrS family protein [Marinospirillum sp.]HKM15025.1 NnrS family protein [Marinospirillum sp.]